MNEVAIPERPDRGYTPADLIHAAIQKGMDPAQLKELVELQERIERRQSDKLYAAAMAICQAEMPSAFRDKTNSHTGSKYATYESLNDAIKPIYSRHGFSLSFTEEPSQRDGYIRLVCNVRHSGGHTEKHVGDFPLDDAGAKGAVNKTRIQATGSTYSYAKRYLVKNIFNVAETDEDNDGNRVAGPVNEDELSKLLGLLKEKGMAIARFLSWVCEAGKVEITRIEETPAVLFEKAVAMLKSVPANLPMPEDWAEQLNDVEQVDDLDRIAKSWSMLQPGEYRDRIWKGIVECRRKHNFPKFNAKTIKFDGGQS
jgi:hypothetical protein